ncbi:MAG TPA: hypothetical protein VIL97_01775, partial [Thermoanaerobaculia bacterium]
DDQLRSIIELRQRRQEAAEPLVAQMRELQRAFEQAIHSGSNDATKLGESILAMRALGQQFEQQEKNYREAVGALLTPEQRERVSAIHGIEMAVQAAGVLRAFGL